MWNNVFVHFSRSVFSQPPHVAHDHQKWLHMNLIHSFRMLADFFLAAFDNFLRMFLQTYQMSNWWLILGRSYPSYFFDLHMPVCCNLFHINISSLHAIKTFWKLYFSILFEFPHSVNRVTEFVTILLVLCSKKVYSVTTNYTWLWLQNFRNHFFFLIDPSFISNAK